VARCLLDMTEEDRTARRRIPRQIRILLSGGIVIFVLEYLVVPQFSLARNHLRLLRHVNPLLIILAVVLEIAAIYAYGELTRTVFTPFSPRRRDVMRVNLSGLAISHVIPGGTAPAGALSYRLYSSMEVPASTNAFGLAAQGSGSAVVLNLIFWLALVISIPLRGINPVYGFASLVGVFLMLAFFGTVLLLTRGQAAADNWLRIVAKKLPWITAEQVTRLLTNVAERINIMTSQPKILRHALYWASANWILDASCLWVFLLAFGHPISPIDLMVAYGLANILAVIPLTPAGLGVIEGVLIPTLVGFGVPHNPAILAILGYRLVNFWLPIPIGGLAYFSLSWWRPASVL